MENTTKNHCSICSSDYEGYGHNAAPINGGRCCSECNSDIVIPTRIREAYGHDITPIINAVHEAKLSAIANA